ncbi:hypothetical protein JQX13_46570 [Archangium violaceum]|uniref:hypothetical protein n=1 Tax=Archangium violaceum TaxID=83451 RepID=UPI00193B5A52|nr:hypothetical protein [Archangium violaceum]QRK07410.1 hypothetical protein JQX13_46570 [Archangium violaceum]
MEEVLVVSLLGMLAFGGLFLIFCPEWWSTSLGTLKEEKKPEAGRPKAGKAEAREADK